MLLQATKEFTFDCAHILTGHGGLCKNLHGHTYKVQVTTARKNSTETITSGPSEGMVVDFKDLKEICNSLFNQFDHAFVYNECMETVDCPERDLIEVAKKWGLRTVAFPERATAENMARYFFYEIDMALSCGCSCQVDEVKVWETPTSFATYRREF